MMDKVQQIRQAKQQLNNPRDSEKIARWATLLAEMEQTNRQAVRTLYEAVDEPPREAPAPIDVEQRTAVFCDIVGAFTPGEPTLGQVWLRHAAPEELKDPEPAQQYLGMDADDWQAQRQTWAEMYRDAGVDGSRDELASIHVQEQYDVDLATFEEAIIGWDSEQAIRDLVTAETDRTEGAILALADHLGGESA